MRFLELKQKEVINCKDCRRLGYVADLEIDPVLGCIKAIIVPGQGKFFTCFGATTEYYIKFCNKQNSPFACAKELFCNDLFFFYFVVLNNVIFKKF